MILIYFSVISKSREKLRILSKTRIFRLSRTFAVYRMDTFKFSDTFICPLVWSICEHPSESGEWATPNRLLAKLHHSLSMIVPLNLKNALIRERKVCCFLVIFVALFTRRICEKSDHQLPQTIQLTRMPRSPASTSDREPALSPDEICFLD
jgi:hypothetical protein